MKHSHQFKLVKMRGFLLLHVSGVTTKFSSVEYIPDPDYDVSNSSEKEVQETLPDHLCTTLYLATPKLNEIPDDIKTFWGDQYLYVSILTVLERDICEQTNRSGLFEEMERLINCTTAMVEKEIRTITNSYWPSTKQSTVAYQKSCVEKLKGYWEETVKAYEDAVVNLTPSELAIPEVDEVRSRFRDIHRDLRLRMTDLNVIAMERNE